jgi:hypothetical protein
MSRRQENDSLRRLKGVEFRRAEKRGKGAQPLLEKKIELSTSKKRARVRLK